MSSSTWSIRLVSGLSIAFPSIAVASAVLTLVPGRRTNTDNAALRKRAEIPEGASLSAQYGHSRVGVLRASTPILPSAGSGGLGQGFMTR